MNRPLYPDYSPIEADLPALLEVARLALADHRFATEVLEEELDIDLWEVQQRLELFMDTPSPAGSTGSPLARALAAVPGYNRANPDESSVQVALDVFFDGHHEREDRKPSLKELAAARAYATVYVLDKASTSPGVRVNHAEQAANAVYQEG